MSGPGPVQLFVPETLTWMSATVLKSGFWSEKLLYLD